MPKESRPFPHLYHPYEKKSSVSESRRDEERSKRKMRDHPAGNEKEEGSKKLCGCCHFSKYANRDPKLNEWMTVSEYIKATWPYCPCGYEADKCNEYKRFVTSMHLIGSIPVKQYFCSGNSPYYEHISLLEQRTNRSNSEQRTNRSNSDQRSSRSTHEDRSREESKHSSCLFEDIEDFHRKERQEDGEIGGIGETSESDRTDELLEQLINQLQEVKNALAYQNQIIQHQQDMRYYYQPFGGSLFAPEENLS